MRAVLQRVSSADLFVAGKCVAEISEGLLVFVGIRRTDSERQAEKLAKQVTNLRIFPDEDGKMNRSAIQAGKSLLIVSQFTLYGNTSDGNRPSYTDAAKPEIAEPIYNYFVELCRASRLSVSTGIFRAHMQVRSINEGPITLICDSD